MTDEGRKYSWNIGKHPSVIALEAKLRDIVDRETPPPAPGLPQEESMVIFKRRMEAFNKVDPQSRDLTNEIASRYDERGFLSMAFCSEPFLLEVLSDKYAAYDFTFDLLFRQNYRFGYSTQLNDLQRAFITLDDWVGRIGNSGAGAMFMDPRPQFLDVWATMRLLEWPAFERNWRKAVTVVMRTNDGEIEAALARSDRNSATKCLVDAAFGPGKFSEFGVEWEEFSPAERMTLDQIEDFTHGTLEELERRVLKSIWKHRVDLIQPHPDGAHDPPDWRLEARV